MKQSNLLSRVWMLEKYLLTRRRVEEEIAEISKDGSRYFPSFAFPPQRKACPLSLSSRTFIFPEVITKQNKNVSSFSDDVQFKM